MTKIFMRGDGAIMVTMRLLCMRLFQYSVTDFERTVNARNCGVIVLERRDDVIEKAEEEGR